MSPGLDEFSFVSLLQFFLQTLLRREHIHVAFEKYSHALGIEQQGILGMVSFTMKEISLQDPPVRRVTMVGTLQDSNRPQHITCELEPSFVCPYERLESRDVHVIYGHQ